MKQTKPADLTSKSVEELETLLASERAGLFQTRRDLVFRKIQDTASIKVRRHNIARILTVMNNKKREAK